MSLLLMVLLDIAGILRAGDGCPYKMVSGGYGERDLTVHKIATEEVNL